MTHDHSHHTFMLTTSNNKLFSLQLELEMCIAQAEVHNAKKKKLKLKTPTCVECLCEMSNT